MNEGYKKKSITQLYALARGQLIGKYPIAILVTVTISMINVLLSFLTGANTITSNAAGYLTNLLITVVVDLLLGVIIYGQHVFYLNISRGKAAGVTDIISGFRGLIDKTILIRSIFTAVSFLSLIPSILIHFNVVFVPVEYMVWANFGMLVLQLLLIFCANLYFGLSYYLLSDHPDWSVPAILSESLILMKKKKGRLTLVYLRAIPLLIVSLLAFGVGMLWFMPFFNALMADFYLDATSEEAYDPERPAPSNEGPTQNPSGSPTLDIRL